MVRDYVTLMYEPVAARADELSGDGFDRARTLAAWKARVTKGWDDVHVDSVESDAAVADLGAERTVEAVVSIGTLDAADVAVQLVHGPVGPNDEITISSVVTMEETGPGGDEQHRRYAGHFTCDSAGRYGFGVRVVPNHPDLATASEMGCVAWA
jgi:starch phosphorylase